MLTEKQIADLKARALRGIAQAQAAPARSQERRDGSTNARFAISDLIRAVLGDEVERQINVSVRAPKRKSNLKD